MATTQSLIKVEAEVATWLLWSPTGDQTYWINQQRREKLLHTEANNHVVLVAQS